MFDLSSTMSKFHKEEVTLSESNQKIMRGRRDTNRKRLKKGLADNKYPSIKGCYSQGSYRMRTMVQDNNNDYDIDDGVYFTENSVKLKTSKEVLDMVTSAVSGDQRFKTPPEQKDKCVRLYYSEGYHIDLPTYKIKEFEGSEVYELATKDGWETSDARQITKWFNSRFGAEINQGQDDPQQIRRIVRLTKKFARSRTSDKNNWKKQMPSGICITKLVVDNHTQVDGRDDESLYETWKNITAQLDESLHVEHPTDKNKTLSDGDYDPKVEFLKSKLGWAISELDLLQESTCTKPEATDKWDSVFNTDFFTLSLFPHVQNPKSKWNMNDVSTISIAGKVKTPSSKQFVQFSSDDLLKKHSSLRFYAESCIRNPFDVYWQIVNTGDEAKNAKNTNGLRGEIFQSETAGAGGLHSSHDESTLYEGTHWIECYIVKKDVYGKKSCVARSGKFFVKIGST